MFSFFKSHNKKSPVVSPVLERSDDATQKSSDDFVVIPTNPSNNIYPSPSAMPKVPNPQPSHHPFNRQVC